MEHITKGQILNGDINKILIRQKNSEYIEMDELLVSENNNQKHILQVFGLNFGSQLSQSNIEFASGYELENNSDINFYDNEIRNYVIASAKPVLIVSKQNFETFLPKTLPAFFSKVRAIEKEDLDFITKPEKSIYFGELRSGSKILDVSIYLDAEKVLNHHILIPATTGKGKSNLCSVIIWDQVDKDFSSLLVFDPHDEYFGRGKRELALKDHPIKEKVIYYSKSKYERSKDLIINIKLIKPFHFNGIVNFSDAQTEAIYLFFKKFGDNWIKTLLLCDEDSEIFKVNKATISVLKRKIMAYLDLTIANDDILCKGIFSDTLGLNSIDKIIQELENSSTVIVDTSNLSSNSELIVASVISSELFDRFKYYKKEGLINEKPSVSIILEEAPRVLGKDVLEKGSNIFSSIAREGRKFKIGLIAITQLPSLIPKQILANMNTKIILGIEMKQERDAITDSAAQDLSSYSGNIASMDKGECLITSNFARFAIPIKIPLFSLFAKSYLEEYKNNIQTKKPISFSGVTLG